MKGRTLVLGAASLAAAALLLAGLVRFGSVDGAALATTLAHARPEGVLAIGLLAGLLAYLSAERWRMIERQAGAHAPPSRLRAFGLTAIGVALGQALPVQLATVVSRAIGSRALHPPASPRPVIVTLYEQGFDVAVALVLACDTGAYFALGRRVSWWLLAAPSLVVGLAAAGVVAHLLRRFCQAEAPRGRLRAWLAGLSEANLFAPRLARRLMLIAVVRFCLTALMAGLTSWTTGLAAPLDHLFIALPLVVVATAAPLTPAGLGINEWTYAAVLTWLGASIALATQWALVNRVLVFACSLVIGLSAVPALALDAALRRARARWVQVDQPEP